MAVAIDKNDEEQLSELQLVSGQLKKSELEMGNVTASRY